MFLLIDRLDQEGSEFGRTVADELAEMLYFQGFTPVVVDSAEFDPATQEAAAIPMAAGNREGQVIDGEFATVVLGQMRCCYHARV